MLLIVSSNIFPGNKPEQKSNEKIKLEQQIQPPASEKWYGEGDEEFNQKSCIEVVSEAFKLMDTEDDRVILSIVDEYLQYNQNKLREESCTQLFELKGSLDLTLGNVEESINSYKNSFKYLPISKKLIQENAPPELIKKHFSEYYINNIISSIDILYVESVYLFDSHIYNIINDILKLVPRSNSDEAPEYKKNIKKLLRLKTQYEEARKVTHEVQLFYNHISEIIKSGNIELLKSEIRSKTKKKYFEPIWDNCYLKFFNKDEKKIHRIQVEGIIRNLHHKFKNNPYKIFTTEVRLITNETEGKNNEKMVWCHSFHYKEGFLTLIWDDLSWLFDQK